MARFTVLLILLLAWASQVCMGQQQTEPELIIQQEVNLVEQSPDRINQVKAGLYPYLTEPERFSYLKKCLLASLQKSPDNKALAELLDWDLIQQKDFKGAYLQEVALDRRGNENGERLMSLGSISLSNEAYDEAIAAFNYVILKGSSSSLYREARYELLNALAEKTSHTGMSASALSGLKAEYESFFLAFGKNAGTANALYAYAGINEKFIHDPAKAIMLLEDAIALPGISAGLQAECKLELGDIFLSTGKIWDAALLYGQVDKAFRDDPLGQEAKFRSAKIYFYTGDFALAKSQLDVLKTATSELIANDALDLSLLIQEHSEGDSSSSALKKYARAELLILQARLPEAERTLDSISISNQGHSLQDVILIAEYRIDMSRSRYQAASLRLQKVISQYPEGIWGDDALFHLAELQQHELTNPAEATRLYQQLILNYPGSFYVPEARKQYRKLRGDKEF